MVVPPEYNSNSLPFFHVFIALTCHHGKILADLASGLTLFWSPEKGFSPIAATERLPFAIVDMPSGGSFRACSFGDRVNKLHKKLSSTKLYAFILPKFNNAL
jgi:hypothetical protein